MKIVAILEVTVGAGGGFGQALNAILQMQRLCDGRFDFEVFTTQESNVPYLESLGITAQVFTYTFVDKMLRRLHFADWWSSVQLRIRTVGQLEQRLLEHGCDLAYFVGPGLAPLGLQKLNYITTLWDLCHRDTPEFPEVREYTTYVQRERTYGNTLGQATLVLTDSKQLAATASDRYGIDPVRFLAMPFSPSPLLQQPRAASRQSVLSKYALKEEYFFYPAQLWAHKNHIRILEALLLLRQSGWSPNVVFCGKDFGNRSHLEAFIRRHDLCDQVTLLGFVPADDLRGLYEGALSVVMPTYFGPTNLPSLEAWAMDKPLICSNVMAEQAGEAALVIDPDNAEDLADAMRRCADEDVRRRLVESGRTRLASIASERQFAEGELVRRLMQFAARRRCWGR